MPKKLKELTIDRVALVASGSNPHADVVLIKSKPVSPQPKEPVFMKKNIDTSKLNAEEQTTMDTLLAKSATDIDPEPVPVPVPVPVVSEDFVKTLPPEAQTLMKSLKDAAEAATVAAQQAQKEAEKATAAALLEKSAREQTEFVQTNEVIVKGFPGKTDDNARLLFRIKKALAAEDYTALETLIKAGNAAIGAGMTERGTTATTGDSEGMNELDTMAKDLQKSNAGMTYSEALEKVMDANPAKVAEIRKANAKKRREADDDN